jgi:hypothetical protein
METSLEITKQLDIETAIDTLDRLYQGWVSSPLCGDELATQEDRTQIAYYYRKIRHLLTTLN